MPLMPIRREIPRLILEDACIDEYDESLPKGSDDELDETTRAAKRRRIEALGESYLRGKPLFISSASLRGPFDNGWVNPWRKHRKRHEAEAAGMKVIDKTESKNDLVQEVIPETDNTRNKKVGGKGIRSDDRDSLRYATLPRSTSHSKRRQSKSSCIHESAKKCSCDVQLAQNWLKREKKAIDIQNYDPPKSPSNRYTGSGISGAAKRPNSARMKTEPGLTRAIKSHQTDLRNVRRNKNVSGDAQQKRDTSGSSPTSSRYGEHNQPRSSEERPKVSRTLKIEAGQTLSAKLSNNVEVISPMVGFKPEETTVPASASSIHVAPPSSHLPEFHYRLAKLQSMEESEKQTVDPSVKPEVASSDESPPKNSKAEKELPQPRSVISNGDQDQASVQGQTSTATLGSTQNQNESSTESEKIPSAQIVPKPPGNSDCFISLHSTEICGFGAADSGTASLDGELSTQAAFELAQRSFQDDLATPQKDNPSPKRKRLSSVKRITPFARIHTSQSMFDMKIDSKNTPGATHNMDTQAMIDAFTPFSEATPQKSGKRTGQKSALKSDVMNSHPKKTISFAASPRPLSRSISLDRSSFREEQDSGQESLLPLPLTLSGATPATNQQDGQGVLFSMDAFDVSQVIHDAGSWLQQSWDIGNDLKRCSGSTERGTQSSPPSSRRELTFI